MKDLSIIPPARIENRILLIRGERVIIDADLAAFYGVTTRRLNEQVRRNAGRFPPDFVFQLTPDEKAEVVANCDHLGKIKYSNTLPHAFTEHGAIMAANLLNSPLAVEMGVFVVRAFISLRRDAASHHELAVQLAHLERRLVDHDQQLASMVRAIRTLMGGGEIPRKRRIGFDPDDS
jgi:hypothetical protein